MNTSALFHSSAIGALVILMVLGFVAIVLSRGFGSRPRYRPTPLMTGNELEFFGRLQRALPEVYVFPQVAMSALIAPTSKGRRWRADFGRISQKRVDWCLYAKKGMALVVIVELDDRTHSASADAARDALTGSAGIRTVRFASKQKPTEQKIRELIAPML